MKKMKWTCLFAFLFSFSCIACNKAGPSKTFTILWKNYDGSLLEEDDNVPYMSTPNYDGNTPLRESNKQFSYVFTGWDKEIVPAKEDVVYKACFKDKLNYYSIDVSCINCSIGGRNEFTEYKYYGDTISYQFDRDESENYFYPNSIQYIVDGVAQNDGYEYDESNGTLSFDIKGNTVIKAVALTAINLNVINPGTFSFECGGLTSVDWGDGTINNDTTHYYQSSYDNIQILVYGNINNFKIINADSNSFRFNLSLANSNTNVPEEAYKNSGIVSATIPNSVKSISSNIFAGCSSIESLTMPSLFSQKLCYYFGFSDNKDIPLTLKNVELTNCTSIGQKAFQFCGGIVSFKLPNGLTSIEMEAFDYCQSLSSINIPDTVITIGTRAFRKCDSLFSITLPDSLISIGSTAFISCPFSEIIIPNNVTTIGQDAFSYCKSLSFIQMSSSLTTIGTNAFASCSSLLSIKIPNSVTSIGDNAFGLCENLSLVDLSDLDHVIKAGGSRVFQKCKYSNNFIKVKNAEMLLKYQEASKWENYKDYMFYE